MFPSSGKGKETPTLLGPVVQLLRLTLSKGGRHLLCWDQWSRLAHSKGSRQLIYCDYLSSD
jgi:hypothetical protein